MVVLLLTFLAGKVIYDEHKGRKIRKAERAAAKAEAQYRTLSKTIGIDDSDNSPAYVAREQEFGPPAYHKDVRASKILTSESLVSIDTTGSVEMAEKNPARYVLA